MHIQSIELPMRVSQCGLFTVFIIKFNIGVVVCAGIPEYRRTGTDDKAIYDGMMY